MGLPIQAIFWINRDRNYWDALTRNPYLDRTNKSR